MGPLEPNPTVRNGNEESARMARGRPRGYLPVTSSPASSPLLTQALPKQKSRPKAALPETERVSDPEGLTPSRIRT